MGDLERARACVDPVAQPRRAALLGLSAASPGPSSTPLEAFFDALLALKACDTPTAFAASLARASGQAAARGEAAASWLRWVVNAVDPEACLRPTSAVLLVDLDRRRAWWNGAELPSFGRADVQLRLLRALGRGPASRQPLYEEAWRLPYRPPSSDNTLYVTTNRLRNRLGDAGPSIETGEHGFGLAPEASVVTWSARSTQERIVDVPPPDQPLTSFFGRVAELATLADWWAGSGRLLSLVGPGGAGKTRLARAFSQQHRAVFVPLAAARTRRDVEAAVADALGLGGPDAIAAALEARRRVLVLDNAEQVSDEVGALVVAWLARSSSLRVLVTSRRPLGLAAEHRAFVEGLAAPDATALFLERAGAGGARIDPGDPLVGQIVGRVGGLPLALELAAARAARMPLRALHDHLLAPGVLRGGADLPPRQRTLDAVVGWSWDLLSEPERVALMRLAVFRGGAPLDAVDAVVGGEQAFAHVLGLVDHSLVSFDDTGRVTLHELVREHTRRRLVEAGDEATAIAAHGAFYAREAVRYAGQLDGPAALQAIRWLRLELDNLCVAASRATDPERRAALALAAAPALHGRSVLREIEVLEASIDTRVSPLVRARLSLRLAIALRDAGQLDSARGHHDAAVRLADELDDHLLRAEVATLLQGIGDGRGAASAIEGGQTALALAERARHAPVVAEAHANLAVSLRQAGRIHEALEHHGAALRLLDRVGRLNEALWRHNHAVALLDVGRVAPAEDELALALRLAREQGDERLEGVLLTRLAHTAHQQHAFVLAVERARRAAEHRGAIGDPVGRGLAELAVARAQVELGDAHGARATLAALPPECFSHVAVRSNRPPALARVALELGEPGAAWDALAAVEEGDLYPDELELLRGHVVLTVEGPAAALPRYRAALVPGSPRRKAQGRPLLVARVMVAICEGRHDAFPGLREEAVANDGATVACALAVAEGRPPTLDCWLARFVSRLRGPGDPEWDRERGATGREGTNSR